MYAIALGAAFGISLAVAGANPCLTAEEAQALVREVSDAVEEIRRLEDQHFDLEAVRKQAGESMDSVTASSALIEGSAMVVMLAYLAQRTGLAAARSTFEKEESKRAARLRGAPSFTQRSLSMPNLLGITFLLRGKPWEWHFDGVKIADINQAYADPPRSTQQILHPEQYWNRGGVETRPLELPDLSDVLGEGWSKAAEGSIGELGLAVLVGNELDLSAPDVLMPSRWTHEAAIGVVSDVFHHYVKGEQRVTVLATRWESSSDAEQFCRAMKGRRSTVTYGANVLIASGDVGDKRAALAMKAFQQMEYCFRQ